MSKFGYVTWNEDLGRKLARFSSSICKDEEQLQDFLNELFQRIQEMNVVILVWDINSVVKIERCLERKGMHFFWMFLGTRMSKHVAMVTLESL